MKQQRGSLLAGLALLVPLLLAAEPLRFSDINGESVDLGTFSGKWVVVNYWATWCPPCLEEIPDLVLFHEEHRERDAVVVGFNMESISRERLRGFVDDNFITYPIIPETEDMVLVGAVPGLPTTYLIAPDGTVAAQQVGTLTAADIEKFIKNYPQRRISP